MKHTIFFNGAKYDYCEYRSYLFASKKLQDVLIKNGYPVSLEAVSINDTIDHYFDDAEFSQMSPQQMYITYQNI